MAFGTKGYKAHKQVKYRNLAKADAMKAQIWDRCTDSPEKTKRERFTLKELCDWYDRAKIAAVALGEFGEVKPRQLVGFMVENPQTGEMQEVGQDAQISVNWLDIKRGFVVPVFE